MRLGRIFPALRGVFTHVFLSVAALGLPAGGVEPLPAHYVPDSGAAPHEPARALPPSRLPVGAAPPEDAAGPGLLDEFGPLGLPCGAAFSAAPALGGTAQLRLEAPCLPGARVVVSHGTLMASFRLSDTGVLETVFPAFANLAQYSVQLPDGERLETEVQVPGAAGYERVVTMWHGTAALSVHAYEFGAGSGDAGHVWAGAPRGVQAAESGRGGFLLALGSGQDADARRAEVYTFPVAAAARGGTIRIALAPAVTPQTCGRMMEAETLQLGEGLPGDPVALRIALPDCGAASGDLMLKNLARDLKIAAR